MTYLIEKATARECGIPRYFTGELCVNGHLPERYTKNRNCIACQRIHDKGRHRSNPEYQKQWYKANRPKETEKRRAEYAALASKAMAVYDTQCEACGIEDPVILQWHHKNGGGRQESQWVLHHRIIKSGRLREIMPLCANCHIKQNITDGTKGTVH